MTEQLALEFPTQAGEQLTLDLAAPPSFAAEDFLVAPSNRQAFAMVQAWPSWPDSVLTVQGPAASGKSHLASIWAERAGAVLGTTNTLGQMSSESLLRSGSVLIEDADRAAFDQTKLFHLLNLARAQGGFVMLTARSPLERWGLELPDLSSRLRQAPIVALGQPDAELMRALLAKLFVDRQLDVDPSVVDYVAMRLDRSFDAARRMVEAVDREALSQGRSVSRPLVAAVLERHAAQAVANGSDRASASDEGELSW